jgi:hypothetical protein
MTREKVATELQRPMGITVGITDYRILKKLSLRKSIVKRMLMSGFLTNLIGDEHGELLSTIMPAAFMSIRSLRSSSRYASSNCI